MFTDMSLDGTNSSYSTVIYCNMNYKERQGQSYMHTAAYCHNFLIPGMPQLAPRVVPTPKVPKGFIVSSESRAPDRTPLNFNEENAGAVNMRCFAYFQNH